METTPIVRLTEALRANKKTGWLKYALTDRLATKKDVIDAWSHLQLDSDGPIDYQAFYNAAKVMIYDQKADGKRMPKKSGVPEKYLLMTSTRTCPGTGGLAIKTPQHGIWYGSPVALSLGDDIGMEVSLESRLYAGKLSEMISNGATPFATRSLVELMVALMAAVAVSRATTGDLYGNSNQVGFSLRVGIDRIQFINPSVVLPHVAYLLRKGFKEVAIRLIATSQHSQWNAIVLCEAKNKKALSIFTSTPGEYLNQVEL